jgi:hypothetical protein
MQDRTKRLALQHHRAQWIEAAKADPTTTGMGTQPVPKPKDTTYIPAADILAVTTSHIGDAPIDPRLLEGDTLMDDKVELM